MKIDLYFVLAVVVLLLRKSTESTRLHDESAHVADEVLARVAFGSCNHAEKQGFWDIMTQYSPQRLMLLGDNIYADKKDALKRFQAATVDDLTMRYKQLHDDAGFQRLVSQLGGFDNILATWDDHDYGINDGDRTYPLRVESRQIFLDFFQVPSSSPRRSHDGVYYSQTVDTQKNFTYKMIVMDCRYNKDPYGQPNGDFLGAAQWEWLETELQDPSVDLILLGSSIQILPTGKVVEESWSKFPAQRERLLRLLLTSPVPNILLLSGDIHTGEILKAKCGGHVLTEFTASGLTHTFTEGTLPKTYDEAAPLLTLKVATKSLFKRLLYTFYQFVFPHFFRESPQDHYQSVHFGLIDVVVDAELERHLVLQIIGAAGRPVITRRIPLLHKKEMHMAWVQDNVSVVCEPFWGPIPPWRLWLCVAGLSMIPVFSIGGPIGLAAAAIRFAQLYLRRNK